jgi:hypothetical protein
MMLRITLLWIVGLLTIVPFATHQLLFVAEHDQYALLITVVLFWIFGFWGVVTPLVAALKVRRVFRALEEAQSRGQLAEALRSDDAREVAIELIASENRIPRFLAARVFRLLARGLEEAARREVATGSRVT